LRTRHLTALGIVALIAVGSSAIGHAGVATARLRITFVTPKVSPGGLLTFKVAGPRGARCLPKLFPPGGAASTVLPRHALPAAGNSTWRRRLPAGAKPGRWSLRVSCSPGKLRAAASFIVSVPLRPADVVVDQSGFNAETSGSTTSADCGLVLENRSPDSDARNVTVKVDFTDSLGAAVATTTTGVAVVPAGQTFNASCSVIANGTLSIASMKVAISIGKSVARKTQLPAVTDVMVTAPDESRKQMVTGRFTNPYAFALTDQATIQAVFFDAAGHVIGGDQEGAGAGAQPARLSASSSTSSGGTSLGHRSPSTHAAASPRAAPSGSSGPGRTC
jgi:hypothetical protein